MIRFEASASQPGPDDNAERHAIVDAVELVLRDAELTGKPYRYLEGRAVPYEAFADIGWYVEQHAVGSFERSTKGGSGKAAPLLLFHDNRSFPIGHAESWRHEADGMYGVWRLNDRAEAQRAASAADERDLVGLSVGFQPIRSDWELVDDWAPELGWDHKDRCTRLESRLLEVSLTPTPAFAEAQVTEARDATVYTRGARARFVPELDADRWRAELDKLRSAPSA
jgi:HK97 family phage prohead protease